MRWSRNMLGEGLSRQLLREPIITAALLVRAKPVDHLFCLSPSWVCVWVILIIEMPFLIQTLRCDDSCAAGSEAHSSYQQKWTLALESMSVFRVYHNWSSVFISGELQMQLDPFKRKSSYIYRRVSLKRYHIIYLFDL